MLAWVRVQILGTKTSDEQIVYARHNYELSGGLGELLLSTFVLAIKIRNPNKSGHPVNIEYNVYSLIS